jgi:hypothetical protein
MRRVEERSRLAIYLYHFMDNDDAIEGFSNLGIILCVQRYDSTILVENKVVVAETEPVVAEALSP